MRRSNIGRNTRRNQANRRYRENINADQQLSELQTQRQRNIHREIQQENITEIRRVTTRRENRNARAAARASNAQYERNRRALVIASFHRIAFNYEADIDYYVHPKIFIGEMDKECNYCHALKFKNETPGMCCSSGKYFWTLTTPFPLFIASKIHKILS